MTDPSDGRLSLVAELRAGRDRAETGQVQATLAPHTSSRFEAPDQAQAEGVLRRSLAQLSALMEHVNAGVLFEDEERQVLSVNQLFCDMVDVEGPSSVIGASGDDVARAAAHLFADPEGFVLGLRGRLARSERLALVDGRVLERDHVPIRAGEVLHGHLWLFHDVTGQARAEEELRLEREKTETQRQAAIEALRQERDLSRALAAAAAVVSSTLEPEQVLDRLLEQVSRVVPNDAANVMLIDDRKQVRVVRSRGYDRFGTENLVAATILDLKSVPNLRQMAESGQPQVISHTTSYAGWLQLPHHAWQQSYAAAPIRVREEVVGFLNVDSATPGFFTQAHADILRAFADHAALALANARLYQEAQQELAERKQLEARLIQAQRMEAVGRLAGSVAHDFNNHLTAIGGYAELLLLSMDWNDPRRDDVAEICRSVQRSSTLTRQLLAFSRKQIFCPEVLDLNELIADTEKMLRRLVGEDVTLITALDPGLLRVRVDPGQIEQVLMNLAVNARDAMPHGGRLVIETANAQVEEGLERQGVPLAAGSYVLLSVDDDGQGMDAEILSRIFEPFFTTKEPGLGTGLGLATVYGIVKQSGGYVFCDSQPGQGSRFSIYLPAVQAPARDLERPGPVAALERGDETILLVEDDSSVRAFARRVLEESGYAVLAAADGEQALATARGHGGPIHLLLTDVVMPGGPNGRAVAESLAAERPEMRVLYMSGYSDDDIIRRGVLEKGVPFVQKPFSPAYLAAQVRQALA